MASIEEKIQFSGKSDQLVYEAAVSAVPQVGLEIWKTREIARLIMAKGIYNEKKVRCNIVISMVDSSTTITVESDDLGENAMAHVLVSLKDALIKQLG
jgi:hypothetical protein